MSAASLIARGQAAAEALMVDACTITRAGTVSTDPDTGVQTTTSTTIYSGKCKVAQRNLEGRDALIGEAADVLLRIEVHVPVTGTTGLAVGDLVTITTATLDADLSGKTFRVHDLVHKTFLTARRLGVVEVT